MGRRVVSHSHVCARRHGVSEPRGVPGIVAPERIVFTDAFGPGWVPSTKAFMTAVVTFEEFHGKTLYTARAWHWNAADCQAHDDMGFHRGWGESVERLVALVTDQMPD